MRVSFIVVLFNLTKNIIGRFIFYDECFKNDW